MKVRKLKSRIIWGFNPRARTVPSKKIYVRSKEKSSLRKAYPT